MRSTLFWKLFALQLTAMAVLIAGALALMRLQTVQSFSAYLESREQARLEETAVRAARGYAESGNLFDAAREILPPREGRPPRPPRPRGPRPPEDFERPPHDGPQDRNAPDDGGDGSDRPPPPEDRPQAEGPRGINPPPGPPLYQVQEPDGRYVAGNRLLPPLDHQWRAPIQVSGRTVGWIARPPFMPFADADEAGFGARQSRGMLALGAGALLLAGLTSAWLAGLMLRPVRALTAGAARLAQRDFSARLPVTSGDELGRLAEDFNRLAESLERYDLRSRQWLADVAHELRTPLAVLRGELEAAIDGVRRTDAASMRSLHQEVLRLGGLVEDLHLLSSADTGGLALHRVPSDLGELAREAQERFAERFAAAGFQLVAQVPPGRLPVLADPQRIGQVLANLLENALRHAAPPGPVTIQAGIGAGGARVAVTDAGPGVPEAALSRLFDRLYRVDPARSRRHGGAGLGLSICRSIVEAHGGQIEARRSAAGGLEIGFTLPAVPR
ncbi:MAG TPA: ATP-binding protein [Solimonas sp.]|nr:ATP-binding protein [Solimonas sp.]